MAETSHKCAQSPKIVRPARNVPCYPPSNPPSMVTREVTVGERTVGWRGGSHFPIPRSFVVDRFPESMFLNRVVMIFRSLLVLLISRKLCFAQNATDILSLFPELSDFSALVNSYPRFLAKLQAANNFTLLVPNNTALSQWRAGQIFSFENSENNTQDYIEETLSYHLLNGTYPTADFGKQPQFISTGLSNESWSLVTGGQRVEAVKTENLTFI